MGGCSQATISSSFRSGIVAREEHASGMKVKREVCECARVRRATFVCSRVFYWFDCPLVKRGADHSLGKGKSGHLKGESLF